MGKFSVGDRVNIANAEPGNNPGTIMHQNSAERSSYVLWDSYKDVNRDELIEYADRHLYLIGPVTSGLPAEINTDGLADWERDLLAPAETLESLSFAAQVDALLQEVGDMLKSKNAAYGDAALTPLRVFSKLDNAAGIRVRLDDKLSRIARGDGSGDEDAVLDLMGYVILLRIAEAGK